MHSFAIHNHPPYVDMHRTTDLIKQNMKMDISLLLGFAVTKVRMAKMYAAMAMFILWMSLCISTGGVQSVEVSICSGEQLNLTCHVTTPGETLLSWSLMIPGRFAPEIRFISSAGSAESASSTFTVGQTVFRFLRTSTSPLISMIIINSVTSEVNETRLDCSYGGSTVSTTVNVVNGNAIPKPTIITNEVKQFENETTNTILEWTVQEEIRGLTYNVSVFPQANLQYNGLKTARLALSYNIPYNVSIAGLCGENSSPTLLIELHYVKCDDPFSLLTEANRRLVSTNYNSPTIEGTNVTFSCSDPQLIIEGPNSSTCMENGKWEPDPRNVECIENDIVTSGCCNSTESPGIGNSSTVDRNIIIAAAVTVAVIFFILGCCACGWFGHRLKKSAQARSDKSDSSQQPPTAHLYEELQPRSLSKNWEEEAFELEENVAYGPLYLYDKIIF